jgi:hypothetical protein
MVLRRRRAATAGQAIANLLARPGPARISPDSGKCYARATTRFRDRPAVYFDKFAQHVTTMALPANSIVGSAY